MEDIILKRDTENLGISRKELIPMESGAGLSAPQDTAIVRVAEERQAEKKQRNCWWTEDNCPRLKEALVNSQYPCLRGQCDEACLELGLDIVTKQQIFNFYRGLAESRSNIRMTSLRRIWHFYQKFR